MLSLLPVLNCAHRAVDLSKANEVVVSKTAWSLISDACEGTPVDKKVAKNGEVKVDRVQTPVPIRALAPLDTTRLSSDPMFSAAVRAYVPKPVLAKLEAGQHASWLCELRSSTVIFVNLRCVCFLLIHHLTVPQRPGVGS